MDKVPLLFDTDIGSDIDDAVALAYLLRQPRCELLGVTTVTGDVDQRAALVEVLCKAAGKGKVPIHCGRREVFLKGPGQPKVPQYEALADIPHKKEWKENTAVEFLRETIRSRPGEITLLTVGPYGNVALLFALDPEIPFLLKGLVSMGGRFFSPGNEWNIVSDPLASAMAYHAPRREHLSVGLDVTLKCRMSSEEVRKHFKGEPLQTVLKYCEPWFRNANEITFHDPLAAAMVFHPGLCSARSGRVTVEEDGRTAFVEGNGPDRVCEDVDVDGFFEEYFSVAAH